MYEAVHAYPDGKTTVARHAATAARYGYDGLVVRTRSAFDPATSEAETDLRALRTEYDIDIVRAVEITADDPTSAAGAVGNHRPEATVLCLAGGTTKLNRFAVESPRLDVLTRPMQRSGDMNHVLAKAARENNVAIEFDFGPLLRSTGGERVRALADLRKLREIVTYYDAPHVVSANPRSHLELRAPREVVTAAEAVGFDPTWVRDGLRGWDVIATRNRERRSEAFIEPGVRRGRYEEDR